MLELFVGSLVACTAALIPYMFTGYSLLALSLRIVRPLVRLTGNNVVSRFLAGFDAITLGIFAPMISKAFSQERYWLGQIPKAEHLIPPVKLAATLGVVVGAAVRIFWVLAGCVMAGIVLANITLSGPTLLIAYALMLVIPLISLGWAFYPPKEGIRTPPKFLTPHALLGMALYWEGFIASTGILGVGYVESYKSGWITLSGPLAANPECVPAVIQESDLLSVVYPYLVIIQVIYFMCKITFDIGREPEDQARLS